jgi:hypothetical protein
LTDNTAAEAYIPKEEIPWIFFENTGLPPFLDKGKR